MGITIVAGNGLALTVRPANTDIALNREVTRINKVLNIGDVLPERKAAIDAGGAEFLMPKDNERDVQVTPNYVWDKINVWFVTSIGEVPEAAMLKAWGWRSFADTERSIQMDVLVDYSNLPRADRSRGPAFVVDKVIATLGWPRLASETRVSFRFYDGWYEHSSLTKRAQDVSAAVAKDFPATRTITDGTTTKTMLVNVELAYSLMIDPSNHLWHT